MKIVFFGTPDFSVPFLNKLLDAKDIEVVAVVTQPDKPVGRGHEIKPSPVKVRAIDNGIMVLTPATLKNYAVHNELRALEADVFVVVAYGKLIPPKVLPIPRLGCVNVHPSLLPKYRGPSPINAAIEHGDKVTGVSIMLLDEGMDTGPIISQKTVQVKADDTTPTLSKKIQQVGAPFLVDTLRLYESAVISPTAQSKEGVSVTNLLDRESGHIVWNEPAVFIERKIRAYTPWPGTYTIWNRNGKETRLKILRARIEPYNYKSGQVKIRDFRLFVGTSKDSMEILELQAEGKKPQTAGLFLKGYPDIEGARLN